MDFQVRGKSGQRADPSNESEGQTAHAACTAPERQRESDLPRLWSFQGAFLYLEEALQKKRLGQIPGSALKTAPHRVWHPARDRFFDPSPTNLRKNLRMTFHAPMTATTMIGGWNEIVQSSSFGPPVFSLLDGWRFTF